MRLKMGSTAWSLPPSSSGLVVNFILAVLDHFRDNVGNLQDDELTAHRMVEAFKFAFARRSELGDVTGETDDGLRKVPFRS